MNLNFIKEDGEKILEDELSVMKFWHDRKRHHRAFCSITARVLATPVSYTASERVFSALKLFVTDHRSRLSSQILEDIVLIWSVSEQLSVDTNRNVPESLFSS